MATLILIDNAILKQLTEVKLLFNDLIHFNKSDNFKNLMDIPSWALAMGLAVG